MSDELLESLTKQGKPKKGIYLFFNKKLFKTRLFFTSFRIFFDIFKFKILILLYHFFCIYILIKLIKNL